MDQLNFLRSNIENPESATALSQNTSAHKRHPNQKEEIDLSDETFEKILFELAILLAGVGFGKDDKPTEMGYYIEDLIDALHAG
ncbi:MAG TPA: hypothetical protein VGL77_20680 [Armatimonadota bacterium]